MLREAALLHGSVLGLQALLSLSRRLDARVRHTLSAEEVVFQFRTERSARRLVIADGRVRSSAGLCTDPDFEVVFVDLEGALRRIREEPGNLLSLLVENKIEQRGNTYYLFELGYLLTLSQQALEAAIPRRMGASGDRGVEQ